MIVSKYLITLAVFASLFAFTPPAEAGCGLLGRVLGVQRRQERRANGGGVFRGPVFGRVFDGDGRPLRRSGATCGPGGCP